MIFSRNLEEMMGKTWSEMKIEFVTWFKEGDRFRVIVKASASHTSTRWHGFARFVLCDEFETTKSSRYSNPMIQYKTSQNAVEIESHMIRPGVPGQCQAVEPEESKRRKKAVFLGFAKDIDVIRAVKSEAGDVASLKDLGAFPSLEAHRRVMRLEKHLCDALSLGPTLLRRVSGDGQASRGTDKLSAECATELEWLREHRTKALTRNYFVFEYLSVYVPTLCSNVLEQDLKLTTERRAHAAVRDSWPLMEYGGRLSGLLDKLGERVDAGWRAFGFKDNGWLPMGFQVGYEKADLWKGLDPIIQSRNAKEAEDVRQATLRRKDTDDRVPRLLAELRAAGPGILAGDTWQLDRTRDLPPTASAPDAASDPIKFLALASMED